MLISIEAVCRKCGKGDVNSHTVSDWDKVKALLVADAQWECSFCGCGAAYWYFRQSQDDPSLTKEELKKLLEGGSCYDQVFECTVDAILTKPVDFTAKKINPITKEEL